MTSRPQWTLFSMVQWPRMQLAMWAGDASRASRLVMLQRRVAGDPHLHVRQLAHLTFLSRDGQAVMEERAE